MSFKVKEIGWRNLLSTGNQYTVLIFDETTPMTLVTGASGSGKTTMMDALSLCWYGKALRPINKPALVNSINGKDCEVYTIFQKYGKLYKVTRGIKPNTLSIECDGLEIEAPAGSELQDTLDEIVGVSFKVFKHVVALSPSSYVPFMQMTPKERREVVEELRELHIFTEMAKAAKSEIDALKTELSEIQNQIRVLETKKSVTERFLAEANTSQTEQVIELKSRITTIESEIIGHESEKAVITGIGASKKDDLSGYEENREKHGEIYKAILRLKERNETLRQAGNIQSIEKCPTCYQIVGEDHKHSIAVKVTESVEKNVAKIQQLEESLEEKSKELDKYKLIEKELTELRSKVSNINTMIQMKQSSIKTMQKDLDKLQTPKEGTERHLEELKTTKECLGSLVASEELKNASMGILVECQKHLKDDGIKASLVEEFIPTFNNLVNQQLDQMDFFVQFDLDRDFNETIKSRHRDVFTYYSFSEGEKLRIDLALLFAWRMLSELSGIVLPDILLLDEVFDSSLDSATADRVVDILINMSNTTNIVAISHSSDLPPVFSRSLVFTKQKNYSIMSVEHDVQ